MYRATLGFLLLLAALIDVSAAERARPDRERIHPTIKRPHQTPVSRDPWTSSTHHHHKHSVEILRRIKSFSEGRELLARVQREGGVHIAWRSLSGEGAEALWDGSTRTIWLDFDSRGHLGELICSVVFELHNALSNRELEKICRQGTLGQLTKEAYVESIERIEHRNALKASQILERGVAAGYFPQSASWWVVNNFDDYYRLQQLTGHSQWLGNQYDMQMRRRPYTPYRGTIRGLGRLSSEEKSDLIRLLMAKAQVAQGSEEQRACSKHYLCRRFRRSQGAKGQHERHMLTTIFGPQSEWEELFCGQQLAHRQKPGR